MTDQLALAHAPAGDMARFGGRWRLVGFGVFNVWRYAGLNLCAPSGRVLVRGTNGTGKTTALEMLWPYLMDLERGPGKLAAGSQRNTTLVGFMRENRSGDKRIGYVWMTLTGPGDAGELSYGCRWVLSGDKVRVEPFRIPGRPEREMPLTDGAGGSITTTEAFTKVVESAGGQVFDNPEAYVSDLATRVFGTSAEKLIELADRVRKVRRPDTMEGTTAAKAAAILKQALPGVNESEIAAVAKALSDTETTREAFQDAEQVAETLDGFAKTVRGYTTGQARRAAQAAAQARTDLTAASEASREADRDAETKQVAARDAHKQVVDLEEKLTRAEAKLDAIKEMPAYKERTNLRLLKTNADRAEHLATARANEVDRSARQARDAAKDLLDEAKRVVTRVDSANATAAEADPRAGLTGTTLPVSTAGPKSFISVGGREVDTGHLPQVPDTRTELADSRQSWLDLKREHDGRAAGARTALREHESVQKAERGALAAADQARRDQEEAYEAETAKRHAARELHEVLRAAIDEIAAWSDANTDLAAGHLDAGTVHEHDEASSLLDAASVWERDVIAAAADQGSHLLADAKARSKEAVELRTKANGLRIEAGELRSGKTLTPIRPSWATGATEQLFADALAWHPGIDPALQANIESAMDAAGLLGATLTTDGLEAGAWQVTTDMPKMDQPLSAILAVDPQHEFAHIAQEVLARIAFASTATHSVAGTVIGADGTFRLGVLLGMRHESEVGARYIGQAQRTRAALARAAELENYAAEHELQAGVLDEQARALKAQADALRNRAQTFPPRKELSSADRKHDGADRDAARALDRAEKAEAEHARKNTEARALAHSWTEKVRAIGLDPNPDSLKGAIEKAEGAARSLATAVRELAGAEQSLSRLLDQLSRALEDREQIGEIAREARQAYLDAQEQAAKWQEVDSRIGAEAEDLTRRYGQADEDRTKFRNQLSIARPEDQQAQSAAAVAESMAVQARDVARAKAPEAERAVGVLRTVCALPDVADILTEEIDPTADDIVERVLALPGASNDLQRKSTDAKFEQTRDRLRASRGWTLDRGEPFESESGVSLETYRCTVDGQEMTVGRASELATKRRDIAKDRLDAREQEALRDFLIRRMPKAVGTAWERLQDWIHDVNSKMRIASASSGVRVQIRHGVRDDLTDDQRMVYDLACKQSAATRTPEEDVQLAEALKRLMDSSLSEDMEDKVREAMAVTDWLRLDYRIQRGGTDKEETWGRNTTLSNGESRLVALAPMLASVAAAYDSLPKAALRLAALDEVPTAVDGVGLDGLARYVAELDLDIVLTSHAWDGAPGHWDGVDIYDLDRMGDQVIETHVAVRAVGVAYPGDVM